MTNKELQEELQKYPDNIDVDVKMSYYISSLSKMYILNGVLTLIGGE